MAAEDFLEAAIEADRQLALCEGENARLRAIVVKLFKQAPSLTDDESRLVTRIMREADAPADE